MKLSKRYINLIFCLAYFGYFFGQEPTNPAAKSHYRSTLKAFEKIKTFNLPDEAKRYENELQKTQEKIGFIKQYEPAFDISSLQKTQDELMSKLNAVKDNQAASSSNAYEIKKELTELFKDPSSFYQPTNPDGYKAAFVNYESQVNNFLSNNGKARTTKAIESNTYLEKEIFVYSTDNYPQELTSLDNNIKNASDETSPYQNYYKILHHQKYWQLAYTLFQNPIYKSHYEATSKVLSKYGSIEKVVELKNTNKQKMIADKQMPAAMFIDAELSKLFEKHFYAFAKVKGWDDRIVKINLLTSEWTIVRDKYDNKILGRYKSAAIATQKSTNYVVYDQMHLYQDYNGSNYTKTYISNNYYGPDEILKENIK